MKPYYETDFGKLYHGDCLEVMDYMIENDIKVDAIITDPPYGIKADKGAAKTGGLTERKQYNANWDSFTPTKEYFDKMLKIAKVVIVFGGNFFTDKLPVNGHWIVWNKLPDSMSKSAFGDCELAWSNIKRTSVSMYKVVQQGFIAEERERFHPTQKPINLISAIIRDYTKDTDTILDCFSGSGTTGLAAEQLNRKWVMIEKEQKYCDVTVQRFKKGIQQVLF